MSKVYVVNGEYVALANREGKVRAVSRMWRILKTFDTARKAVDYITYVNIFDALEDPTLLTFEDDWKANWIIETITHSDDQKHVHARLIPKGNKNNKHWIVELSITEMEVE